MSRSIVSRASLRRRSRRSWLDAEWEATPPPPKREPTLPSYAMILVSVNVGVVGSGDGAGKLVVVSLRKDS